MGKWAERAGHFEAEETRADSANSADSPPFGTNGTNGTKFVVPINPALALRQWHASLSSVDQFVTPAGWQLDDWLRLTDTAFWLYENHAAYAVRHGWTGLDLFGVRPGYPERGGLADLLNGARNLKLSGGKAYWSHFGASFSIGIGIGKGCVPIWELK